jgi:AraC-like DNA-binding protein
MKSLTWVIGHRLGKLLQKPYRHRKCNPELVSGSPKSESHEYLRIERSRYDVRSNGYFNNLLLPFEASLLIGGRIQNPLDQFLEFINSNIGSHTCEVEHVADQIGISPSYLRETIRRQCGTTPGRIIEKKKMERAIRLMADPNLTVCRVAVMSGYVLERSFRKAFRKRLNAAPSDVRRAILTSSDPMNEVNRWLSKL